MTDVWDAFTMTKLGELEGDAEGDAPVVRPDVGMVITTTVTWDVGSTQRRSLLVWDIRDLLARPRFGSGDNGPEIRWDLGVLQFSPSVNGPWTDLPAASPLQLSPIGEKGFFRVKVSVLSGR